jgi:hypothetical protein
MRLLLALLCLVLLAAPPGRSQALPFDNQGKVSFYEVVPADSLRAGTLYAHAKHWLHRYGYTLSTADSVAGRLIATQALAMYDRGYLTKKLHGKVRYQLTLEVKDGRYRLQFTDFVFDYYHEDRTYRLVPTGKAKPLEDSLAAGWQKLWQNHRHDTLLGITTLQAELKTAMLAAPKPTAPPLPSRSANW